MPELLEGLADRDGTDPDYPLSLVNGQRRRHNADQICSARVAQDRADGRLRARTEDLGVIGAADG